VRGSPRQFTPAIDFDLELEPVALVERRHSGTFDRRDMHERVGLAVIALNEAEALIALKNLTVPLAFSPVS